MQSVLRFVFGFGFGYFWTDVNVPPPSGRISTPVLPTSSPKSRKSVSATRIFAAATLTSASDFQIDGEKA